MSIRFEDLGEVIQKLLKSLKGGYTEDDIQLLKYVTVKDMAKVYEGLWVNPKDPEAIWKELKVRLNARVGEERRDRSDAIARQEDVAPATLRFSNDKKKAARHTRPHQHQAGVPLMDSESDDNAAEEGMCVGRLPMSLSVQECLQAHKSRVEHPVVVSTIGEKAPTGEAIHEKERKQRGDGESGSGDAAGSTLLFGNDKKKASRRTRENPADEGAPSFEDVASTDEGEAKRKIGRLAVNNGGSEDDDHSKARRQHPAALSTVASQSQHEAHSKQERKDRGDKEPGSGDAAGSTLLFDNDKKKASRGQSQGPDSATGNALAAVTSATKRPLEASLLTPHQRESTTDGQHREGEVFPKLGGHLVEETSPAGEEEAAGKKFEDAPTLGHKPLTARAPSSTSPLNTASSTSRLKAPGEDGTTGKVKLEEVPFREGHETGYGATLGDYVTQQLSERRQKSQEPGSAEKKHQAREEPASSASAARPLTAAGPSLVTRLGEGTETLEEKKQPASSARPETTAGDYVTQHLSERRQKSQELGGAEKKHQVREEPAPSASSARPLTAAGTTVTCPGEGTETDGKAKWYETPEEKKQNHHREVAPTASSARPLTAAGTTVTCPGEGTETDGKAKWYETPEEKKQNHHREVAPTASSARPEAKAATLGDYVTQQLSERRENPQVRTAEEKHSLGRSHVTSSTTGARPAIRLGEGTEKVKTPKQAERKDETEAVKRKTQEEPRAADVRHTAAVDVRQATVRADQRLPVNNSRPRGNERLSEAFSYPWGRITYW